MTSSGAGRVFVLQRWPGPFPASDNQDCHYYNERSFQKSQAGHTTFLGRFCHRTRFFPLPVSPRPSLRFPQVSTHGDRIRRTALGAPRSGPPVVVLVAPHRGPLPADVAGLNVRRVVAGGRWWCLGPPQATLRLRYSALAHRSQVDSARRATSRQPRRPVAAPPGAERASPRAEWPAGTVRHYLQPGFALDEASGSHDPHPAVRLRGGVTGRPARSGAHPLPDQLSPLIAAPSVSLDAPSSGPLAGRLTPHQPPRPARGSRARPAPHPRSVPARPCTRAGPSTLTPTQKIRGGESREGRDGSRWAPRSESGGRGKSGRSDPSARQAKIGIGGKKTWGGDAGQRSRETPNVGDSGSGSPAARSGSLPPARSSSDGTGCKLPRNFRRESRDLVGPDSRFSVIIPELNAVVLHAARQPDGDQEAPSEPAARLRFWLVRVRRKILDDMPLWGPRRNPTPCPRAIRSWSQSQGIGTRTKWRYSEIPRLEQWSRYTPVLSGAPSKPRDHRRADYRRRSGPATFVARGKSETVRPATGTAVTGVACGGAYALSIVVPRRQQDRTRNTL